MKNIFIGITVFFFLASCNPKKNEVIHQDNRITLRADTLNVLTMKDTAVIYESVCRGCAYEQSTTFKIVDRFGIVEIDAIETYDNNPPDMDGGNISKTLVIVPLKTGTTHFKLYRLNLEVLTMDSLLASHPYKSYLVQVK